MNLLDGFTSLGAYWSVNSTPPHRLAGASLTNRVAQLIVRFQAHPRDPGDLYLFTTELEVERHRLLHACPQVTLTLRFSWASVAQTAAREKHPAQRERSYHIMEDSK